MRIKVDENISRSAVDILRHSGLHDVRTIYEQGLSGASDDLVSQVCNTESRVLITLDRDFGQVHRFPPRESAGIVVLELGGPATASLLHARLREFLTLLETRSVNNELWIIEPGRVRVHLEKENEN